MRTGKTSSEFKAPEERGEGRSAARIISPANVLTSMRIAFSGILLLLEPLGAAFYCVYGLAGVTDMLDGTVARKTGTESRVGAVLDTAADFVFMVAACVKLFPVYWEKIPVWMLVAVAFLLYLRVKNAIVGFVMYKRIVTMHTLMNKATGVFLFAFPFACAVLPLPFYSGLCVAAAFVATADAFVRMVIKDF